MNHVLLLLAVVVVVEFAVVVALVSAIDVSAKRIAAYQRGYEVERDWSDYWRDEAFRARGMEPPHTETPEVDR